MGYFDYENFKQTIIIPGDKPITKYDKLYNSIFCLTLGTNLTNEDYFGKILNYHCFKYTKMREEIYFIMCNVVNFDSNNKLISTPFVFLVNSKSFWKRFNIYLKDNPNAKLSPIDMEIEDFIYGIRSNTLKYDRIELNILSSEKNEIEEQYNRNSNLRGDDSKAPMVSLKDFATMHNCLKTGAKCYLTGLYHYNKRICIDLFSLNKDNNYGKRVISVQDENNNGNTIEFVIQIDDSKNGHLTPYYDKSSWFYYEDINNSEHLNKYRQLYD